MEALPQYLPILIFALLAGLAIGSAVSMVAQPNPLYGAISLVGVFIALSGLYILLAAPFIAAVQMIVYAGAIMVLVVFVIMLLNVEVEERKSIRMRLLIPAALGLGAILLMEVAFIIRSVNQAYNPNDATLLNNVGLTQSIGIGLFTEYLLPFEITSVLLLMAIVGAITLARRIAIPPGALVVPGSQTLGVETVDGARAAGNAPEVVNRPTGEPAQVVNLSNTTIPHK